MTSRSSSAPKLPSRPRLALFAFLGVYPLATALLYLLVPLTLDWAIWQRNLLVVPIIVVMMVWVIIPRIHRHLGHLL